METMTQGILSKITNTMGTYEWEYVEEFPFCCGVSITGDCDRAQDIARGVLEHVSSELRNYGLNRKIKPLVYTSIVSQKRAIEMCRRLKFAKLTTWRNPNTQNVVTLWMKKQFSEADVEACLEEVKRVEGATYA
jgi:hypothetical protein